MAFIVLAEPGTENGPYGPACEHTDCGQTREIAAKACTICGKPLGYGRAITDSGMDYYGVVHNACLAAEMEREARVGR